MKKTWIIVIVLVVSVFIIYRMFAGTYNDLVIQEEEVEQRWAQVENQYQRRADLIPNLVNTVKGYADFEQETLTEVIEARAKATAVNVNPENLDPAAIQRFQEAQEGLSSALSRLMVVVERYPDLKASQQFQQLQTQLEGTENRIAVERRNFNQAVQGYNSYLRQFPTNMIAGMYGFERKGYFEATQGAEQVPQVEF
ncbi:MAG: LemA family protein [Candidatus Cyclobacteriaceae bacterium M2_1C_046]